MVLHAIWRENRFLNEINSFSLFCVFEASAWFFFFCSLPSSSAFLFSYFSVFACLAASACGPGWKSRCSCASCRTPPRSCNLDCMAFYDLQQKPEGRQWMKHSVKTLPSEISLKLCNKACCEWSLGLKKCLMPAESQKTCIWNFQLFWWHQSFHQCDKGTSMYSSCMQFT